MATKLDLDTGLIQEMYTQGRHSAITIAKMLGVSYSAVYDRLKASGVVKREKTAVRLISPPPEELRRLYEQERLSTRQLCARLGASGPIIRGWLRKAGVQTRSISEAKRGIPLTSQNAVIASVKARRKYALPGRPDVGYRMAGGYVLVQIPAHPDADASGYVREHRLIMERAIGRRLLPHEDVHHKNEIRHDNRLENLELKTHADHLREHVAERERDPLGRLT